MGTPVVPSLLVFAMPKLLTWSEAFSVGHPALDAEHRRIAELINAFITAVEAGNTEPRSSPTSILRSLRDTTVEHLRNENAVLWELRSGIYAGLKGHTPTPYFARVMAAARFDEHMIEHEKLLGRFDELSKVPMEQLCDALKAWFLDHAVHHDAQLKTIFQAI